MLKVISMYLPQFHEIIENNEWWGKGYTEWSAVNTAKKIDTQHYQPRIPLNNNYYDLLDKDTMLWQSGLMKKYGVYGQSFYHYYFENGRKILEKPAENLLMWTDIDMPFCFTWANESWVRTWSAIQGVTWNSIYEEKPSGDGILIKQNYGNEKEWTDHFYYLLDFFRDNRYIKIDNKPLFIIYKPLDIHCINEMADLWNKLALENEFDGIYLVGINAWFDRADAMLQLEANNVGMYLDRVVEYDEVCNHIITSAVLSDEKVFYCGTPGYDDTPRRGIRGSYFKNSTPKLFYNQIKYLAHRSEQMGNEFLFVNAWNEWGEGMYLEPDEKFEYEYLRALKAGIEDGIKLGKIDTNYSNLIQTTIKEIIKKQDERILSLNYYEKVLDKLLLGYENGQTLTSRLNELGYYQVAIYGLGKIGKHVVKELASSNISIKYGIDKDASGLNFSFPIYNIDEDIPPVDIIIVTTPKADFDNLKSKNCKYVTLESLWTI